jgi:predicted GIY-YIG superfamily endonuclease
MFIYCIEDINDKKYIGSTARDINVRLIEHRYKYRNQLGTTSQNLNLYNCIIYVVEECDPSERLEREKYWIRNTDCVNQVYND